MLFYNPHSDKPFPFFSESASYYHHPVAQAREFQELGGAPILELRGLRYSGDLIQP